jgi:hypothetical protein
VSICVLLQFTCLHVDLINLYKFFCVDVLLLLFSFVVGVAFFFCDVFTHEYFCTTYGSPSTSLYSLAREYNNTRNKREKTFFCYVRQYSSTAFSSHLYGLYSYSTCNDSYDDTVQDLPSRTLRIVKKRLHGRAPLLVPPLLLSRTVLPVCSTSASTCSSEVSFVRCISCGTTGPSQYSYQYTGNLNAWCEYRVLLVVLFLVDM